jgi:hypothetical protein
MIERAKQYPGFLTSLVTVLMAFGCSEAGPANPDPVGVGGSGAAAGGNGGNQDESLCAQIARVQCEAAACCPTHVPNANCEAEARQTCEGDLQLDAIAADPATGFNEATFDMALAEFESRASSCQANVAVFVIDPVGGLRGAAAGTLPAGADCTASNMSSQVAIATALASCANPATSACLPSETTWTCAARGPEGAPCFTDANCDDNLYCDNPDTELTGAVCVARKAAGEACSAANECLSLSCGGGACSMPGPEEYCF